MNDYTEFDKALIENIGVGVNNQAHLCVCLKARAVQFAKINRRGHMETNRVIDRRLQALRKKGVIAYSSKKGWQIV